MGQSHTRSDRDAMDSLGPEFDGVVREERIVEYGGFYVLYSYLEGSCVVVPTGYVGAYKTFDPSDFSSDLELKARIRQWRDDFEALDDDEKEKYADPRKTG